LWCGEQAFKYHSNLDEPCPAVDSEVKSEQLNGKKRQVVENSNFSDDSKIFMRSETNSKKRTEELKVFSLSFDEVAKYLLYFHTQVLNIFCTIPT
jgi:hypothetical protein